MQVRFHRIRNNHARLRSEVIEGETEAWPKVGKQFFVVAPPFENPKPAFRWLQTSVITGIIYQETGSQAEGGKAMVIFRTESGSIYAVEEL